MNSPAVAATARISDLSCTPDQGLDARLIHVKHPRLVSRESGLERIPPRFACGTVRRRAPDLMSTLLWDNQSPCFPVMRSKALCDRMLVCYRGARAHSPFRFPFDSWLVRKHGFNDLCSFQWSRAFRGGRCPPVWSTDRQDHYGPVRACAA